MKAGLSGASGLACGQANTGGWQEKEGMNTVRRNSDGGGAREQPASTARPPGEQPLKVEFAPRSAGVSRRTRVKRNESRLFNREERNSVALYGLLAKSPGARCARSKTCKNALPLRRQKVRGKRGGGSNAQNKKGAGGVKPNKGTGDARILLETWNGDGDA